MDKWIWPTGETVGTQLQMAQRIRGRLLNLTDTRFKYNLEASPGMKEAVVQNPLPGSAAADSSPSDSMAPAPAAWELGTERWGPAALEQRRECTRNHLAKIAARRETWINRNGCYYELLNRFLRFLVEPQKKGAIGSLSHR